MRVGRKLRPGQPGTKKLTSRFGSRLVCVRYRYDMRRRKRYTTVELIVASSDWTPREVALKIDYREGHLWGPIRRAGGKWDPAKKVWRVRYEVAEGLGLIDRIVREEGGSVYNCTARSRLDLDSLCSDTGTFVYLRKEPGPEGSR